MKKLMLFKIQRIKMGGEHYELELLASDKDFSCPIVVISTSFVSPIVYNVTSKGKPLFIYYDVRGHYGYYQCNEPQIILKRILGKTYSELRYLLLSKEIEYKTTRILNKGVVSVEDELDSDVFPVLQKISDHPETLPDSKLNYNELFISEDGTLFFKASEAIYLSINSKQIPLNIKFYDKIDKKHDTGFRIKKGKLFDSFFMPILDEQYKPLNYYLSTKQIKKDGTVAKVGGAVRSTISVADRANNDALFLSYSAESSYKPLLKDLSKAATYYGFVPERKDIGWMVKNIVGESKNPQPWNYTQEAVNKEVKLAKYKKRIRRREKANFCCFMTGDILALIFGVSLAFIQATKTFIAYVAFDADDDKDALLKYEKSSDFVLILYPLFTTAILSCIAIFIRYSRHQISSNLNNAKELGAGERPFFKHRLEKHASEMTELREIPDLESSHQALTNWAEKFKFAPDDEKEEEGEGEDKEDKGQDNNGAGEDNTNGAGGDPGEDENDESQDPEEEIAPPLSRVR